MLTLDFKGFEELLKCILYLTTEFSLSAAKINTLRDTFYLLNEQIAEFKDLINKNESDYFLKHNDLDIYIAEQKALLDLNYLDLQYRVKNCNHKLNKLVKVFEALNELNITYQYEQQTIILNYVNITNNNTNENIISSNDFHKDTSDIKNNFRYLKRYLPIIVVGPLQKNLQENIPESPKKQSLPVGVSTDIKNDYKNLNATINTIQKKFWKDKAENHLTKNISWLPISIKGPLAFFMALNSIRKISGTYWAINVSNTQYLENYRESFSKVQYFIDSSKGIINKANNLLKLLEDKQKNTTVNGLSKIYYKDKLKALKIKRITREIAAKIFFKIKRSESTGKSKLIATLITLITGGAFAPAIAISIGGTFLVKSIKAFYRSYMRKQQNTNKQEFLDRIKTLQDSNDLEKLKQEFNIYDSDIANEYNTTTKKDKDDTILDNIVINSVFYHNEIGKFKGDIDSFLNEHGKEVCTILNLNDIEEVKTLSQTNTSSTTDNINKIKHDVTELFDDFRKKQFDEDKPTQEAIAIEKERAEAFSQLNDKSKSIINEPLRRKKYTPVTIEKTTEQSSILEKLIGAEKTEQKRSSSLGAIPVNNNSLNKTIKHMGLETDINSIYSPYASPRYRKIILLQPLPENKRHSYDSTKYRKMPKISPPRLSNSIKF